MSKSESQGMKWNGEFKEWYIFGSKNAERQKFNNLFIRFFQRFMWCLAFKRKESIRGYFLIFQHHLDYAQITSLSTFTGAKLTYFTFLVSLLCSS